MNKIYQTALSDPELFNYASNAINNPYKGTILEPYDCLQPTQKGKYGEEFIKKVCLLLGYSFTPRQNKQHDLVIAGKKAEIKFSVEYSKGFRFNHIAASKDFDRLVVIGVNKTLEPEIKFFEKSEVITIINERMFKIKRQQNGKKGSNDDWMITPDIDLWNTIVSHPFAKDFSEW